MAGISEALVATAIGLLVALPAVVAFNVFRGNVKSVLSGADVLARTLLGYAYTSHDEEPGGEDDKDEDDEDDEDDGDDGDDEPKDEAEEAA